MQYGIARLPHALLLCGPEGVGKAALGRQLAERLLCESATDAIDACGQCDACHWLKSGNHPDFRLVAPGGDEALAEAATESEVGIAEKPGKRAATMIKIDQIRDLEDFVFVGSHRAGHRVVLILQSEAMNAPAANALLKILEEPPAGVYFILVTSRTRALLPTIRSRCRVVSFARPDATTARTWLAEEGISATEMRYLDLCSGAPMKLAAWKAQGLLASMEAVLDSLIRPPSDPLALAARWDGLLKSGSALTLEHLVEIIQRWLFDQSEQALGGDGRYHSAWPAPAYKPSPTALLAGWKEMLRFRRSARHPLNQLLFLEDLALHTLRALSNERAEARLAH